MAAPGAIVVAGLGSIGRRHARVLRALDPGRTVRLYRSGHGAPLTGRLARLPVEHGLDAALGHDARGVIVANPTALHLPVTLQALRAGCHVLLEKPIAHSLEGLDALVEQAAWSRRILVGFQWRFHPGLRAVKRWLDEGRVGEVVHARAYWGEWLPGWHPSEDYRRGYAARADLGGGVLLTLCHPFDYLRFLLGEVDSVSAESAHRSGLELDVEDVALVTLRMRSGALASVALDYARRPAAHALRVTGRRGVIAWDGRSGVARLRSATGRGARVTPPPGFTRARLFRAQMRHWLACVDGGARPACTLDDGMAALRVVVAAKQAARDGRRVSPSEV